MLHATKHILYMVFWLSVESVVKATKHFHLQVSLGCWRCQAHFEFSSRYSRLGNPCRMLSCVGQCYAIIEAQTNRSGIDFKRWSRDEVSSYFWHSYIYRHMQIMCFDLLGYSKDAAHATGQVDGFNTWNIALTAQLCYIWCLKTWTWITHIICIIFWIITFFFIISRKGLSLLPRGVPLEGFGTDSCWGRWELSFQFDLICPQQRWRWLLSSETRGCCRGLHSRAVLHWQRMIWGCNITINVQIWLSTAFISFFLYFKMQTYLFSEQFIWPLNFLLSFMFSCEFVFVKLYLRF